MQIQSYYITSRTDNLEISLMPYDNTKTVDAFNDIAILSVKIRSYEATLNKIRGNFNEIADIIAEPETKKMVPVFEADGTTPVMENGKQKQKLETIPAKIKIRQNERTYNTFTEAERIKIQTAALPELAKIKTEIDKLT